MDPLFLFFKYGFLESPVVLWWCSRVCQLGHIVRAQDRFFRKPGSCPDRSFQKAVSGSCVYVMF